MKGTSMNTPLQNNDVDEITTGLRFLDRHFAQWVVQHFGAELPRDVQKKLESLALAVSHATALQHTCLDLQKVQAINEPLLNTLVKDISAEDLQAIFTSAIPPLVANAESHLVWLQKYHYFEQQCARQLLAMARERQTIDAASEALLDKLFATQATATADEKQGAAEQKSAARMALASRLALITGGPGTGKTYTVARIIAVLVAHNPHCNIVLAAPTGKAAQRMKDSIRKARQEDSNFGAFSEAFDNISASAKTLHSLLGIGRDSPKPWRNAANPLVMDVLIVDEASMIDLPMMHRLLDALPAHARLIMLGDKDQLASVEAGSVLAELCQAQQLNSAQSGITVSRRFGEKKEIGQLAQWLNGNSDNATPNFASNSYVLWHNADAAKQWNPEWLPLVKNHWQQLMAGLQTGTAIESLLKMQGKFQVLCALNKGPYGVQGINDIIERSLAKSGKNSEWYAGKPVIILQNDKERKLYNGDVGMVLPVSSDSQTVDIDKGELKACFITADGIKTISRAQIPLYQTCYVITVHKSQGSEYRHVLIVLPVDIDDVKSNPVLTRELAYTAVTRASETIDLWSGEGVLEIMASRRTVRMSGLASMLDDRV